MTFEVGPLPFGLDRLTVSKLCGQWGWQARPLHPSRSVEGTLGNLWLVKACANPPSAVVKYQGSDVEMLLLILLSCLVRFSWISMLVGSCLSLLRPLARVLQTAYRAELKAILVALEYAIRHDAWCRIWTDCVNAIKAFKLFLC